jgi:hypothetical protein
MTATVAFCPPLILQFTDNQGRLLVGGSVLTQVGGVNTATYQDNGGTTALPNPIPLNSRGEISNSSGQSQQLFLIAGNVYTFTIYDASGNQIDQPQYVGNSLSGNALISGTLSGTTTLAGTLAGSATFSGTLTGGTLASPTITGAAISGGTISGAAITGGTIASATISSLSTLTVSGVASLGSVDTLLVQAPSTGSTTGYLDLTGNLGAIGTGWRVDANQRLVNPGASQSQVMAQLTASQTSGSDIIWNNIPAYGVNRQPGGTLLNTGTGVVTIPTGGAGDWLITVTVNVANNSGGGHNAVLQINRNGSNIIAFYEGDSAASLGIFTATFTAVLTLAAADTIKVTKTDAAWSSTIYCASGSTFSMRQLG